MVDPSLQFIEFIRMDEEDINSYSHLAGSYAIIQVRDEILFGYNRFRNRWELPAGRREGNESPKECAIRELFEETGQKVEHLAFQGIAKIKNLDNQSIKYNPIFYCKIDELSDFIPNEEMDRITLWNLSRDIGQVDQVDLQIWKALKEFTQTVH
ncbi:MAG: NUDIX hydrolase [Paenisporosarcina sp.]